MNKELELGGTYAERKNEAELAELAKLSLLAEDDSSCSKSSYKLGF